MSADIKTTVAFDMEAAVIAALKTFCKAQGKYVQQCFLATTWSPDGKPSMKEEMWEPKTLK